MIFWFPLSERKKLGKKQRLSKKAKIWPMPPTYAVGQQEVIADTSMHGKEKADFRKEYYKLKILKIMKDRETNLRILREMIESVKQS